MTETDDGFCSVEVGADSQQSPDTAAPQAKGDEIAWDLAATGGSDKTSVEVTEYDVVLPEQNTAHADHETARPHTGLFSRLRRAASKTTGTDED